MVEEGRVKVILQMKDRNGECNPHFSGITLGATEFDALKGAYRLMSGMIRASRKWKPESWLDRSSFLLTTQPDVPIEFGNKKVTELASTTS